MSHSRSRSGSVRARHTNSGGTGYVTSIRMSRSIFHSFQDSAQTAQFSLPEPPRVVCEPGSYGIEAVRLHAVDTLPAVSARDYDACFGQDAQLLRNSRKRRI